MFYEANSKKFMIFAEADTGDIYSVAISVSESPCEPLEIKRSIYISSPEAVDYDPFEGKVYWTDVTTGLVAKAFPNGSSIEVVAEYNICSDSKGAGDRLYRTKCILDRCGKQDN